MAKTTPTAATAKAPDPIFISYAILPGTPPRHMEIRVPSPEQLAVWHSVGDRFTQLGAEWAHKSETLGTLADDHPDVVAFRENQGRQASRGLVRALKIIRSVLAAEDDYLWVEDQIMEGANLEQALGVVSQAARAIRERAVTGTPAAPARTAKTKLTA